jgi:hypothetical protein
MTVTPLTEMDAQGSARLKQITPACQVGPTERGQASARSLAFKDGTIMSLLHHSKRTKSATMAISSKMTAVHPNA